MTDTETTEPILTERFDDALAYASRLHRWRRRRDGRTPYLAHLLGVASTVLQDGGSEEEAIAALLHDAIMTREDVAILNEVRRRYGVRVAGLVEACTDHDPGQDRPAWEARKAAHIVRLRQETDTGCLRILLADAVYNARELLRDLQTSGEEVVWARFSAGRRVLDYLDELATVFAERLPGPQADELRRTVDALQEHRAAVPA